MLRKILLPLILLQLAAALYAKDEIWIDFGALPPGYTPEDGVYVRQYDPAPIQADDPTVIDYTNVYNPLTRNQDNLLPTSYADQIALDGSSAYDDMRLSLALDRWQVKFSSSSDFIDNRASAQVLAYRVKDTSSRFPGEQIMAVYFSLPDLRVNSKVWIVPEFLIPAYSAAPGADLTAELQLPPSEGMGQFLHMGVLRNVGAIRSITATVYGRRFPLTLTVESERTDLGKREYPMGSLQFSGWQDLVWTNPNYVTDVRKREYSDTPDYPHGMPSIILRALRLDRPMSAVGEDTSQIVFYIKQIRVVYDEAVSEELFDSEISDEAIWQLNAIDIQRQVYSTALQSRAGAVDRYNELQSRHNDLPPQESPNTASQTSQAAPANANAEAAQAAEGQPAN